MGKVKGQRLHMLPNSMEDLEIMEAQTEMLSGNSRIKAEIKKQLNQIRKRLEAQEKLAQENKRREIIRRLHEAGWKGKNED